MINFVHSKSPATGAEALTQKLVSELKAGKKVLWLICGGSNIPTAVDVMNSLQQILSKSEIGNLTVMQTDERYGPVGHSDSNWQQLLDLNLNIIGVKTFPILRNLSLQETVQEFGKVAESAFAGAGVIVGQFGLGPDGHIAGILPHTPAVSDKAVVSGYEATPFTRITLTFDMLRKISVAYVFAFGESKKKAIDNLKNKDLSLDDEPAQILKQMPEVYLYSDCY